MSTMSLAGTNWRLLGLGSPEHLDPAVADAPVTLSFVAESDGAGRLSGSAGCNGYFGGYTISGDQLSIGPVGATRMECPDPGVMEQEMRYLRAISSAERFDVEDGHLQISYPGGILRFEPLE